VSEKKKKDPTTTDKDTGSNPLSIPQRVERLREAMKSDPLCPLGLHKQSEGCSCQAPAK